MFLVFEGLDGTGKTTQAQMLYDFLKDRKIPTILTREIGGTKVGERIRTLMFNTQMLHYTELLLVMAARHEHLQNVIHPALNSKKIVICDRFIDSTAIYQNALYGVPMDKIYKLYTKLMPAPMYPQLTIVLHADFDTTMRRINMRDITQNNRLDSLPRNMMYKINNAYQKLSRTSVRAHLIDASLSVDIIHKKIIKLLQDNFTNKTLKNKIKY